MRKFIFIASLLVSSWAAAQEINCTVTVNSDQIEGSNKQVYSTLKTAIEEYMNQNRWTNMTFAEQEKIECSMLIVVKSAVDNSYACEMTLQSRRPVYGTRYTCPLLNFKDNAFNFTYQEFDRIEWQQNQFTTNLTAMLAYYAYVIIGYDMDAMSPMGGTPYLQTAENIVNNAQNLGFPGWSSFNDSKNRFGLLNDYLDGSMEDYRQLIYKYHREGLDQMADNPDAGRTAIAEAMNLLESSKSARTMSQLPGLFTEYKRDELVNIFSGHGTNQEKESVYNILLGINTSLSEYWEKLKK